MDVFSHLLNNRASAANTPDNPAPGVYAIFAKNRNCLPGIHPPSTGLIYIGKSSNLDERNHLAAKHSGFHSPRRSLGAILKGRLKLKAIPRAPGLSETNYRNFRFTDGGEERLTAWMLSNLEYAVYPCASDDMVHLEKRLIRENEPPLNLTGWANPQKRKIVALREECKSEAKILWRRRR
jgi:GIY-YIG catalytic domain-containing protein